MREMKITKKYCSDNDRTEPGVSGCFQLNLQQRLHQSTIKDKLDLQDENFDLRSALFLACQRFNELYGSNMALDHINAMVESYIVQAKLAREDVG